MKVTYKGAELLVIERKTDILSLSAFLLALGSILYQVFGYFRGPVVHLFEPEQILIKLYQYDNPEPYVHFATRMSYVNSGQRDYSAVLKKEQMTFTIKNRTYRHHWQSFGFFTAKGTELIHQNESDARPIAISGGTSESHETYFAPRTEDCNRRIGSCDRAENFLKFDDLIKEIADLKEIKFVFSAEMYGHRDVSVECLVYIDQGQIEKLKKKNWIAPRCLSKEPFSIFRFTMPWDFIR